MSEWDYGGYSEPIGPGLGWDTGGYPTGGYNEPIGPGLGWDTGGYPTGGMTPEQQAAIQGELNTMMRDPAVGGFGGGGNWLSSILGSLGGLSGVLGPALSAGGALAGGAIGSNAASNAAGLQSQALNRGIDLQTAQWLQQQGNLSPYLQAGQQGLSTLQGLAGREQPTIPFQGGSGTVQGASYGLPSTTPGWSPQYWQGPLAPSAGDYRWNPQQGPQAQDYRYTPGQTPDAAGYRWTPGQAPSAAQYRYSPGAVPTLSGQELLANDPGVQFRQDEARKALEGSAAARGDLLSGQNLKALQSRSQDLASQEYGNAFARASQQAQLREQWGQAASQMGFGQAAEEARLREGWAQQASQQGFGQAEAASRLREQVNQVASQQGWSQAQAEAVFREQMAQQSSQQGWNQALAGQQNQYTQGLQSQQWNQQQQQKWQEEQYARMLEQSKLRYGQDVASNQTDYDRTQNLYKQQMAQYLLPWEQQSTLANLGGQAVGMYGQQGQGAANAIANLLGQQGTAQAGGATNQANSWLNALQNVSGAVQGGLQNNALLSALGNLNR